MIRTGMTVWAVTGPAGAGKSVVSGILARHGAGLVDGDELGHQLLTRPEIQAEIGRRLGAEYICDGAVDRAALGGFVFGDPQALACLNEIMLGPLAVLAQEKLADLAAAGQHDLAVFEAAVYFLLPTPPPVDLVVAVVAPEPQRVRRLVARAKGRLSADQARLRISAQADMAEFWDRADEIIVNEGSLDELEAHTLRLVSRLKPGSETQP